jgi:hypothetical protein
MQLTRNYILGAILLTISNYSIAQIYAQGKNINNENVFSLTTELIPKSMDPGKYHASIAFYGQRGDVQWYLKEGVEHKVFVNKQELIAYMEENGWFYLHDIKLEQYLIHSVGERQLFRKSMEQLSREQREEARNAKLN